MMSATETNISEGRVQEIETELVNELAEQTKSSPEVLLRNKAIADKVHERALERAANEAAKRAELERAAKEARDRAAVEKAMEILGITEIT